VRSYFAGFVLVASTLIAQPPVNPLAGVIDFHCHSAPDTVPRSLNDLELVRLARRSGLRGLVLKNHYTSTADRAQLAMQEVGGIEVFGGIALNRAVGGINAEAVRKMIEMEGGRGRVVWLPTFDAENNVRWAKENRPFVSVIRNGALVPELGEILDLVARNDLVLATGHSSVEESLRIIDEAKRRGVKRIVVTHAMADPVAASAEQLRSLAQTGAIIECVWNTHVSGPNAVVASARANRQVTVSEYARAIKAIGAGHFLISSDLGQQLNPTHPDGLRSFIAGLLAEGLTPRDIDLVARKNPARLLGLDPW
jgi:hypothetical protein